MKRFIYSLWSKFLTVFGDIKVFSWPMFMVYDPSFFKMTGDRILEVVDVIQPGDVILRGYDGYLDGKFVPSNNGYSHAGVFIGENTVVHAVAPHVQEVNIVDFCECDRIAILRPKKSVAKAIKRAKDFLEKKIPYDFMFSRGTTALYCFELARECYPTLDVKTIHKSKLFGLIQKDVVLSDSFFESKDFTKIFEYNPKFDIDFISRKRS